MRRLACFILFLSLTPSGLEGVAFGQVSRQGVEDAQLIQLLTQIAALQKESQHKSAVPLVVRALATAEKTLRREDPRYVAVLLTAGEVYWKAGDADKAALNLMSASSIAQSALEFSHPLVLASLTNLALFYREKGEFDRAAPLFTQLVALNEKLHGAEHRDVLVFLKLLSESYFQMGDYGQARPLYERVVALAEKLLTKDRLYIAALNDLTETYKTTGDFVRAALLQKQLLEIKMVLGPDHTSVATTLSNMAATARLTHNFEQAVPLYQRALAIYEKALGADSPEAATVLNQLGLLYSDTGDFQRSEPFFKRAMAIREKNLGAENRYFGETLLNLAWLYYASGDYTRAEPLYLRALQIAEKKQGPHHPNVGTTLAHIAILYEAQGAISKAVSAQARSNDIAERHIGLILSQGTEEQKLLFIDTLRGETYGTISLHMRSAPADIQAAELAMTTILRRKGRVLDVMSDTIGVLRRRLSKDDSVLLDQLSAARSKLATLVLRGGDNLTAEQQQASVARLHTDIEKLETVVSERSAQFREQARPITLAQVQAAIPLDATLVEFAFYRPFKVKAGDNKAFDSERYAVYLLGHEGPPAWVDLGEAASIDAGVAQLRVALRDQNRRDVKSVARALDEKIMAPVRKLLGQTRTILLSPDGALNLIPFGALVDEQGRYLLENYSPVYLTSGRDLLRLQTRASGKQGPVVFANPLYDLDGKEREVCKPTGPPSGRTLNFRRAVFCPLKGTGGEALSLSSILPNARVLTEARATEAALKQLHGPVILHVATHGFFLEDESVTLTGRGTTRRLERIRENAPQGSAIENPLLRSGLAFAGANQEKDLEGENGILTALEAAGLDLWGTRLVVLSACETGLGDIKNGEGVYGLRRAFVIAGAESQVMSLWQVSDIATRDLMVDYYKRLQNGEGRSEALRQVQLQMLRSDRWSHPYYWAAFIQSGDWGSLNAGQATPRKGTGGK